MNRSVSNLLIFAIGAAVGAGLTFTYAKQKYEKIAQEEIDSVKEAFSIRKKENGDCDFTSQVRNMTQSMQEAIKSFQKKTYERVSKECGYIPEEEEEQELIERPYVVSPDDFGEYDDYERISLTYYADGVLADDNDDIVDDIEGTVGSKALDSFGDYEDDAVFVCNDRLKCYYEILKDYREYSEMLNNDKPYKKED